MRWPSRYSLRTKRSAKVLHRFGGLSFKICLAAQVMPIFIFAIDRAHPFDCCMCAHVQHFCFFVSFVVSFIHLLLIILFTLLQDQQSAGAKPKWIFCKILSLPNPRERCCPEFKRFSRPKFSRYRNSTSPLTVSTSLDFYGHGCASALAHLAASCRTLLWFRLLTCSIM